MFTTEASDGFGANVERVVDRRLYGPIGAKAQPAP